jgi:hypothetical protein
MRDAQMPKLDDPENWLWRPSLPLYAIIKIAHRLGSGAGGDMDLIRSRHQALKAPIKQGELKANLADPSSGIVNGYAEIRFIDLRKFAHRHARQDGSHWRWLVDFCELWGAKAGVHNKRSSQVALANAETNCRAWLADMMRQSPDAPALTKVRALVDAQELFSGLSGRAFERAWRGAVLEANAHAWSAAGRRKSPQE